ncbi:flagellar brake protein [Bacillus sp. B1-b2]|uniref:flagellar brake protein n=1 Tax=Bacillus sp. B1-b2 TaxID=2653201 RepID=UPI0012624A46|nr:flagellar brake domain-containing protein [Bacillus sp. B1-b2]KAB7672917.1 pilus assembly protein PilZ [Bacillus sp. B1-b2]
MITIGDTLILELFNEENIEQYKSRILETENNEMYIEYPIHLKTNKLIFLMNGTQVKINFVTNDGVAYMFHSEVLGRKKENNIPMLILSFPNYEQMIKIQRRRYVRVETSVDIAIHAYNEEFKPFTTVCLDFSAGGAAILVPKTTLLEENTKVKGYVVLPLQNGEYTYLQLDVEIKRILDYNQNSYKVTLEFVEVSPFNRQAMLRFSFDRQLSLRKKGLEI